MIRARNAIAAVGKAATTGARSCTIARFAAVILVAAHAANPAFRARSSKGLGDVRSLPAPAGRAAFVLVLVAGRGSHAARRIVDRPRAFGTRNDLFAVAGGWRRGALGDAAHRPSRPAVCDR